VCAGAPMSAVAGACTDNDGARSEKRNFAGQAASELPTEIPPGD